MTRPLCYGCGLADPESICTLASPFTHFVFDYSHKSIAAATAVVEKAQAQLATLDEALQRLQKHRDGIHRTFLHHQNYPPPISRLPDDILLLVFQEATWSGRNVAPETEIWHLAAVCSRWRSISSVIFPSLGHD
ncbi:hypothetical protein BDV98DRAFT_317024 [Pterulicium gracile]|uniref:F-box domain-containing protein n=1 Tax=Pterulicium gracile TaxID=1884261 RepID=A0A5C3QVB0_9AGAR|nr:hypothetical protein BDV98DRAFT_317024 [Pterula gracilis]